MNSTRLGSSIVRPLIPRQGVNRATGLRAIAIIAWGAASATCTQPRSFAVDDPRDGGIASDGVSSGGSSGSDAVASSGGAAGGSIRDAGTGGTASTGGTGGKAGTGGAGSASGTGGAADGSGGRGDPADAGAADTTLPASLTIMPIGSHDFGTVEIGTTTSAKAFVVTNMADAPTGALTLENSAPTELAATGCGASLSGHGTCTLAVTFTPRMAGRRTGTLVLSSASAGAVAIAVSGMGAYRLTVMLAGDGKVTSSPSGLTCDGAMCTGLFADTVALHSVPGPDQLFAGWSGGRCPTGVVRDCSVEVGATTTIKVSFVAQTDNLAFVTSAAIPPTLGAPSNYDKRCNDAATAAQINNSAGDAFVALVSSPSSDVRDRVGTARGWQRLDGRPVMDTLSGALLRKEVFNAVVFDEMGGATQHEFVMTGVGVDGSASPDHHCANFTATTGTMSGGYSDGGAVEWSSGEFLPCASGSRIMCLGKTRSRAVKPTVTTGKRIWLTAAAFSIGAGLTPDAAYQKLLPSGITAAAALIATQSRPAAQLLSQTTSYVRPDGTLIGTGSQISSGFVESGIWQEGDGTYLRELVPVWTGSYRPALMGTSDTTCIDWTSASSPLYTALFGYPGEVGGFWSRAGDAVCSAAGLRLYCLQTAP